MKLGNEIISVGDKIWEVDHGFGRITLINERREYPIQARFENAGCYTYTEDGTYYISKYSTKLLFKRMKVEIIDE